MAERVRANLRPSALRVANLTPASVADGMLVSRPRKADPAYAGRLEQASCERLALL